eukprot:8214153-Pyramimonas_sp.AAC.1
MRDGGEAIAGGGESAAAGRGKLIAGGEESSAAGEVTANVGVDPRLGESRLEDIHIGELLDLEAGGASSQPRREENGANDTLVVTAVEVYATPVPSPYERKEKQ